jgi:hypothetical protein
MTIAPNRLSLSRSVVRAMESLKAMLWQRLFRSSINESFRPAATNRFLWLETLAGLIGIGSQDIHRGGVLRVSAKERSKRAALRAYRRRFLMAEQLEVRALMATITATYTPYGTDGNNGSLSITLPNNAINPLQTSVSQTYVNNATSNLFTFGFGGVTETENYAIHWTSTLPTNVGYVFSSTTNGGSFQFKDHAVKDLTIIEAGTGTTYVDTVELRTVPLNTAMNSTSRYGNLWNNIDITAKKITFGTDLYSTASSAIYLTNTFALASNSIALKSNDSMNFTTTGVTYLGSITVNPAAATGQPYAGDQSLVGPDWGSLGYAPDNPTNYNPTSGNTTHNYIQTKIGTATYSNQIVAVIGDTLYLKPGSVIIPTGDVQFATVQPLLSTTTLSTSDANGFIPRLSALARLNLTVTDPNQSDQSITTAIQQLDSTLSLSAQTNGGNITIQDLSNATGNHVLYVDRASIKGSNTDVTGAITIAANAAIEGTYPGQLSNSARWTLKNATNYGPAIYSDGHLMITSNGQYEANAAWYNLPVNVDRNFSASFGYQAADAVNDGATFTLHNDSRGTNALGGNAAKLGYVGITNSVSYQLNVTNGTWPKGTNFRTDGTTGPYPGGYNVTGDVDIASGQYISVTLRYDKAAQTFTETLTDTSSPPNTYTKTYTGINIQSTVGGKTTAYMGFTGATGGGYATQSIRDFKLSYDDAGDTSGTLSATDITLYATGINGGGGIGNTNKLNLKSSSKGQAITVTAQANDGYIALSQSDAGYGWNEGLILSKLTAAQGGSTATAQNNQVVYNSTPSGSSATYTAGNHNISIATTGPVVVDEVSATGTITLAGSSILQGDDKSPNGIATSVSLNATGTANYVGQVTYTRGINNTSDTLTLPTNATKTWSQLGFVANQQIAITGALAITNNGFFRVKSVSNSTLTLFESEIVSAETDFVTIGNGVIGLPGSQSNGQSNALQLTTVPQFSATTANGSMFLQLGGSVNSTAVAVSAGSANGMPNNVSIASDAQFLITQSINAPNGQAALNMSSGTIFQFPLPAGTTDPTIRGKSVSLTSPQEIGTRQTPVWTGATGGLILNMTATSRSPASAYVVNKVVPTSLGVSTYDGDVTIKSSDVAPGFSGYSPADVLSFTNNELFVASAAANVPVNFSNTDGDHGSDGDVKVTSVLTAGTISAGISSSGTAGTGKILTTGSGQIKAAGSTLNLTAASGIGSAATPVAISSPNALTLVANTNSGLINLKDNSSSSNALSLNAFTGSGDISANWSGDIQLFSNISVPNFRDLILDSISATGKVNLTSTGSILNTENFGISAGNDSTITLAASQSIGTASNPMLVTTGSSLIASGPGSTADVPKTAASIYVEGSSNLTVSQAVATGTVDISATGDLSLAGVVTGGSGTSLTSETGAVQQSAGTITATNLSIQGQSIGSIKGQSFDGSTSVAIPSEASTFSDFTTGFSAGMWVYPTSFSSSGVFAIGNGAAYGTPTANEIWMIQPDSTGGLDFVNTVNGVQELVYVPNALVLNQWQYLAATISTSGTMRVYVNGQLRGSVAGLVPSNVTRSANVIGNTNYGGVGFDGQMSEFSVWDRELTQGEIQAATASLYTPYTGNQDGLLYQNSLGSISGVLQTNTPAIHAIASNGGIYLSNSNSTLNLTADAIGTDSGATANNVTIYSAGTINLTQESNATTQLASTLPMGVFNPGGVLTLVAGRTLNRDGQTASSGNYQTITSSATTAVGTAAINGYGELSSITVTNQGRGYLSAPVVTFSGGGETGATATAHLDSNGRVTTITVDNAGSGFTSAPTVILSSPGDDVYTGTFSINGYTDTTITTGPPYLQYPNLVIIDGTAEVSADTVDVDVPAALITLADLTSKPDNSSNVPVIHATVQVITEGDTTTLSIIGDGDIIINTLGLSGTAGNATIPHGWNLKIQAGGDGNGGSVVFLNQDDTITTTGAGTITITARPATTSSAATSAAALGHLTTGGGTIAISAVGSISVGKLDAKTTGTISVTSTQGAILFNENGQNLVAHATNISEAKSGVVLTESNRNTATAALANLQLQATVVLAAATAANATAVATYAASKAQVAANQTLKDSLKAATDSMQGAVTAAQTTFARANSNLSNQRSTVSKQQAILIGMAPALITAAASVSALELGAWYVEYNTAVYAAATADLQADDIVGPIVDFILADMHFAHAVLEKSAIVMGTAEMALAAAFDENTAQLTEDITSLIGAQGDASAAKGQLLALQNTLTALSAAYGVATTAYSKSVQESKNLYAYGQTVALTGKHNESKAIAAVLFSSPSEPISAIGTVNITATGSVSITPSSDTVLWVTGAPAAGATALTLTLDAGGLSVAYTGTTFQAGSGSSATGLVNFSGFGSVTTVNGTGNFKLTGTSNSDAMALQANSQQAGTATLNGTQYSFTGMNSFQYLGAGGGDNLRVTPLPLFASQVPVPWNLAVQLDGGTGTLAHVTYDAQNPYVDVETTGTNEAGNNKALIVEPSIATVGLNNVIQVTVYAQGTANVLNLPTLSFTVPTNVPYDAQAHYASPATINGGASLAGITPTFTYYRGTMVHSSRQVAAPLNVGTYTVICSWPGDDNYTPATSSQVMTISPAAASKVVFTSVPTSGTAGSALTAIQATVQDAYGNTVTSNTSAVTIAVASGPAGFTAGSTLTATPVNGVATFSNLILNTAGTYTLRATDGSLTSATTASIQINASKVAFTSVPASGAAGSALTAIQVTVQDANGNTVTSNTSTVTIAIATGPAGAGFTAGSTLTATAVNGVATFSNLILNTSGTYALKATDGSLTSATSVSIAISPAAASKLVFTQVVTPLMAGQAQPYKVGFKDAYGNTVTSDTSTVTIGIASGPAGFTSGSTLTATASGGVATFSNLNLQTAGTYTLRATDGSLTSATTGSIVVNAAPANKLGFTSVPTSGTAGSALTTILATVQDEYGNTITSNTTNLTIAVATGPTGAGFTAGSTLTATAVAGVATFSNLILTTAGTYTLKVTNGYQTYATTGSIAINVAAASKVVFTSVPASGTAGSALTAIQATVQDAYGNTVTSNTSTVTIAVASGPAGFTAGSTLTATAVNGVATFSNLILNTAGTYTFTATDGSLTSATTVSVVINAAAASKVVFTSVPTSGTAGTAMTAIKVTVQDAYGDPITTNTSIVTIAVASGPAGFTAGSTLTATAVNGVATFSNLILNTAGTYTFTATDGSLASATTGSVQINAAAASKVAFTSVPTSGTAGTALTAIKATVQDANGNTVMSNTSTVTIAIATGPAGFTAGSTLTATAVNGVATFSNLILNTAGTYTFRATDGSLTSATTGSVQINASKVVFTSVPTFGTAGSALTAIRATVQDANGNTVTSNTSTVTIAVASGPAGAGFTAGSTLTATVVGGVATFSNLILNTAGTYTFTATDGSLTSATSGSIAINAAAPSKMAFTQVPTSGTAGTALTAIKATLQDSLGNTIPSSTFMVTIAVASGPAGFTANSTLTATAVNGVATFSNLILNTAGNYTFTATDGSFAPATSSNIAINAAAAIKVVFTSVPASGTAGSALTAIQATVQDAYENTVMSNTSIVTIAVASGPAGFTAGSTLTATAVNGVATFSNLILNTAGTYTFTAAVGSLTSATSGKFAINAAAASKLAFTQTPSTGTAGSVLTTLTVAIEDAYGNVVNTNTSAPTIALNSFPAGGSFTSSSTLTVAAVNGVATFSKLILTTAGTYTFYSFDGSLTAALSGSIVISPAAASKVVFTSVPTSGTAGSALTAIQATVQDANGNTVTSNTSTMTIAVASGPAGFTAGSTLTATAVNGVATFSNLILNTTGTYTFTATDGSLTSATTVSIAINVAVASKVVFTSVPSSGTAGTAMTAIQATVQDAYGNTVKSNTSIVTIAVASGPAGFTAGSTLTATAVNGVATFSNLILNTAGTYTFTAAVGSLTSATSGSVQINVAAASKLVFTSVPTSGTAGTALTAIQATVQDANGNTVTSNTSTVTIAVASGPAGAGFTAGSTLTATAVNGVATFSNLILNTAGTYTFTATDGSLTLATSGSIVINVAAASKLVFTSVPTSGTAGTALTATQATVQDAYGNTVKSNTSTLTIAVASGPAGFTAGSTLTATAVNGVATFSNLILNTTGTYTFKATDGSLGSLTSATTGSIVINAAAASKVVFTSVPASGTAGSALTAIQATVQDAYGNTVTSDTSTVTIAVASGPAGFTAGSTLTATAVNGLATFSNLILNTAGTYTFTATDGSLTSATSGSIVINASKVVFTSVPTSGTAGSKLTAIQATVQDANGNTVTSNTSTVTIAVASGPAGAGFTAGSTLTATAVNGVATFSNLILNTAGTYTFTATDGSLTSATSGSIAINAAVASKLVFTSVPSSGTAGSALTAIQAIVQDAYENTVTSNTSTVTIAVASGPAGFTAGSTLTATAVNGLATFSNLILNTAGTYTFTATDGSLTSATSGSIVINASKVVFTSAPTSGTAGSALTAIQANVQDANGNTVTSDTSTVTIAVASGPAGFTAGSTLTATAVNGVATFSNLILNTAGTYTLRATDGSLTSATSGSIAINVAAASKLVFTSVPTSGTAGSALTAIQATVQDANGNTITSNTSIVTIAVASGPAGFTGSTLTATAVNGVAKFSNLILNTAGTYTFTATDGSLTSATSGSIVINAGAAFWLAYSTGNLPPSTGTAGSLLAPTQVVVYDSYGNTVTSNTSTVTIAVASGPAGFTAGSTLTAKAVNGVATFSNLILNTAGTYNLHYTDGSLLPTNSNIVISAASATSVVLAPASASTNAMVVTPTTPTDTAASPLEFTDTAGSPLEFTGTAGSRLASFTATITDAYGNTVTSDTSTVTITVHSGPGGFTSDSTLTAKAVSGVAMFDNLTLHTAGTHTFRATAGSLTSATTGSIVISAAAASKLAFTQVPTTGMAGTPLTALQVSILDIHGNVDTSNTSKVRIAVKSGPGGFTSDSTLTAKAVGGVATFSNLTLNTAGTFAFRVRVRAGALTPATAGNIVISAAAASKLVFTMTTSTGSVNKWLGTMTVTIVDAYGNITPTEKMVKLSISSGPSGGNFHPRSILNVKAVNGVAKFSNIKLAKAGTYTLNAFAKSLGSAISGDIDIIDPVSN